MIEDWNSDIIDFDPIPHTYTNRRTKKRYIGVTTFIGIFEPEFPLEMTSGKEAFKRYFGEFSYKASSLIRVVKGCKNDAEKLIAVDKAIKNSGKEYEIRKIQQEVKKEWKDINTKSIVKGSNFHNKQENKANFNRFSIVQDSVKRLADVSNWPRSANNKINLVKNLPDGLHTEIIVSNHEYQISGQIDRFFIETINGVRYGDIDDYKTGAKISIDSFGQFFKNPIDFLPFNKLNIYKLQLLLYAKLAELAGFVPRNIIITHTPNSIDVPKIYKILPFRQDQDPIKLMLEFRKNQLKSL